MTTKCALWARVSSSDQDNQNQLRELRQWAADRGLDVAMRIRDRGFSLD